MRVALHDAEMSSGFPNLALMKLSAWHKAKGDVVEWFDALATQSYDRIYSSKVFSFTPDDPYLPEWTTKGGTGYGLSEDLPEEIEHSKPDYNLYPNINHGLGFLTRGCPRKCPWCVVPAKEGPVRAHADIDEFLNGSDAILLDNNVLAHDHGIKQIEKIAKMGLRVDFNQGLDARLIDDGIAKLLSKVRWLNPPRMACDSLGQMKSIHKAVECLRWHNVTPRRYFIYCLIQDNIDDALERIRFLKGLDLDVFAQPFIPPQGAQPPLIQRRLARWCNHKAANKSSTWQEYIEAVERN